MSGEQAVVQPRILRSNNPRRKNKPSFYIMRGVFDYLHPDGVWRPTLQGESGDFPGYYLTEESAQKVLDAVSSNKI